MKTTNKLTTIIVDDELHCRESLAKLLEWSAPNVVLLEKFEKPKSALSYLTNNPVDVVFLDIEMPILNGFEMLQELPNIDFDVIFTTAYDEFALRAFQVHAASYLLKPIDETELLKAIDFVLSKNQVPLSQEIVMQLFEATKRNNKLSKVAFPTSEGLEFIDREQIIRCESEGNYTRIYFVNKSSLLISKTLKVVAELINAPDQFIRPHASHLVNFNHIAKYLKGSGGQLIMDDGFVVPVSKHKKSNLLDSLG